MQLNGKELKVTSASFGVVFSLKKAISDALKSGGIKIDTSGFDLEKMEVGDIGGIIEMVLSLATDENVQLLLFSCCERVLLGKDKIDKDFFEPVENRQYYYPIMFEVLKVNLTPFFGQAGSLFQTLPEVKGLFQKLKSKPALKQ